MPSEPAGIPTGRIPMKRMRPVHSCLSCRKRRVRCDKEHPKCGRCVRGRVQCMYDESAATDMQDEAEASSSSGAQNTERSHAPSRIEKGHVSVSYGGRSSYKGATFWANAIPSELIEDDEYICETPPRDHVPYNSKWPSAGRNNDLRWGNENIRPPRPETTPRQCRFCGRAYRLSCIQYLLPNQKTCEKLCDIFFATVFPLVPVLHIAEFGQDFRAYWREAEDHTHHESELPSILRAKPAFLCLLSAILFSTLSSASPARIEKALDDPASISAADMYFASMTCATLTGFPRSPTLYSLAAYIIVQSQYVREEEFSDLPDFTGTAFRLALGMGLHRHLPGARFTVGELETRRRLWWYILHLDVMASASSGLSPLFIDEKMANTEMIHQYDETGDEFGKKTWMTDVRYLVAVNRYLVASEIRVILRSHFEDAFDLPNSLNETLQNLGDVTKQISKTTESLLDFSSSTELPTSSSRATVSSFDRPWNLEPGTGEKDVRDFASWSALLLHMMIHKAYCILYQPLLRNATSVFEISERENAIKHAQGFLQLFIRVCDDTISEPFHWMYPGTYQPFQALALLLADLLQHPHSDEASLSRGIVDAVFYLYRVDEGVVSQVDPPKRQLSSSGRSAWSMLARTRKKALDLVGQDQHVLLPSQMISSDNCVCGARIANSKQVALPLPGGGGQPSGATPQPQQSQNNNAFLAETPSAVLDDPLVMSQALFSNGFDWQEFEASIAPENDFAL